MWVLYMAGVLLMLISMFVLFGAVLLLAGEIGGGAQGRVAGAVGVLIAAATFLVGRWMTWSMAPHS
jgi:hypothetical protein